MDNSVVGDLLRPGAIGHLLVIIAFTAALLAFISFLLSSINKEEAISLQWKKLGRIAFFVHAGSIIGIFVTLYLLIVTQHYEYYYVWRHSSAELPWYYKISSFWEGQEGSFLLWLFWHVVLGIILIYTAKQWESPVMTTFSLVQVFLTSMVIGIFFLGYKVGSSPFILIRDVMVNEPRFQLNPDFVPEQGNGLNPLLQNYWMVIHPPTLFLGFASTLVPFCFAVAGLWKGKFTAWINMVHPWTIFSVMILGTGILMGGAWAYESLTFGGFWAWDPVENASLIPWLTMIGGLHALNAYRKSGGALKLTFILLLISFVLILYATFLTRSGILGDTSVHAFTDLGMTGQLVIYILVFFTLSIVLLAARWRKLPKQLKEESIYSREFWLFIGALVFAISSFQICFDTSRPVINVLLGTNLATPSDVIGHYNQWQLPIAILIGMLSAIGLYLKFSKTNMKEFLRKLTISFFLSIAITGSIAYFSEIYNILFIILLFSGVFAASANLFHIFSSYPKKRRIPGSAVAHIGFGILLVGILISNSKQEVISINTMGVDYGEGFDEKSRRENILLYKDVPMRMEKYRVTFKGDSVAEPNTYYKVKYEELDSKTGEVKKVFYLYPNAQVNPSMGLISNPSTKRYLTRDIFTHITSIPVNTEMEDPAFDEYIVHKTAVGDTIFLKNVFIVFNSIEPVGQNIVIDTAKAEFAPGAKLTVHGMDSVYSIEPVWMYMGERFTFIPAAVPRLGIRVLFTNILYKENKIELRIAEVEPVEEYIIMKAIMFPYINLVWSGSLIMIIGLIIAIRKRIKQVK